MGAKKEGNNTVECSWGKKAFMLIFGSCSRDTNFWWVYVLSVVIEQTGLNYENLSPRHTKS